MHIELSTGTCSSSEMEENAVIPALRDAIGRLSKFTAESAGSADLKTAATFIQEKIKPTFKAALPPAGWAQVLELLDSSELLDIFERVFAARLPPAASAEHELLTWTGYTVYDEIYVTLDFAGTESRQMAQRLTRSASYLQAVAMRLRSLRDGELFDSQEKRESQAAIEISYLVLQIDSAPVSLGTLTAAGLRDVALDLLRTARSAFQYY